MGARSTAGAGRRLGTVACTAGPAGFGGASATNGNATNGTATDMTAPLAKGLTGSPAGQGRQS